MRQLTGNVGVALFIILKCVEGEFILSYAK